MFAQLMGWRNYETGTMGVSGLVALPVVAILVLIMAQLIAPTHPDAAVRWSANIPALSIEQNPVLPPPAHNSSTSAALLSLDHPIPRHHLQQNRLMPAPPTMPSRAALSSMAPVLSTIRVESAKALAGAAASPPLEFKASAMMIDRRALQVMGEASRQRVAPSLMIGAIPGQELTVNARFEVDGNGRTRNIKLIGLESSSNDKAFQARLTEHTLAQIAQWQFSRQSHGVGSGEQEFIVGIRRVVGNMPELTHITLATNGKPS